MFKSFFSFVSKATQVIVAARKALEIAAVSLEAISAVLNFAAQTGAKLRQNRQTIVTA